MKLPPLIVVKPTVRGGGFWGKCIIRFGSGEKGIKLSFKCVRNVKKLRILT